MRDVDKHRYSAPEITLSEPGSTPSPLSAKEGDVYGMAMIAYEASSHIPGGSNFEPHLDLQGLYRGHSVL